MQASQLKITLFSTCLLLASASYADSWDVTQSVTLNADSPLTQDGGSGSLQAINAINLGTSSTVKGSQTVNATGHTLTLKQQNGSNNTQAANMLKATTVAPFTQSVTAQTVSLTQANTTTGNTQAANYINAGTVGATGSSVSQNVSANAVNLTANNTGTGTGTNSKQALNMIISDTTGNITQNVTTTTANFNLDANASNTYQAGNYLETSNITGTITQNFNNDSSGSITFQTKNGNSDNTLKKNNNVQAANILIYKSNGSVPSDTINQNAYTNKITVKATQVSSNTSIATLNYFEKRSP